MRKIVASFIRRFCSMGTFLAANRVASLLGVSVSVNERAERERFFYNAFKAVSFNNISGDYAEFGCHGAMTFPLAHFESKKIGRPIKLWGFDSFQGFPAGESEKDTHPHWIKGEMAISVEAFKKQCALNHVSADSYELVPGYYKDTLPPLTAAGEPKDICLAYIDCDLYSSTRDVLNFLAPRLKHGMILAFDDYFCWSSTQPSGERQAMLEVFNDRFPWRLEPFVQFGWHGHSFVVEKRETGN